jgi:hypothetical protein
LEVGYFGTRYFKTAHSLHALRGCNEKCVQTQNCALHGCRAATSGSPIFKSNHHYSLRDSPAERISRLLRGGSLKSRNCSNWHALERITNEIHSELCQWSKHLTLPRTARCKHQILSRQWLYFSFHDCKLKCTLEPGDALAQTECHFSLVTKRCSCELQSRFKQHKTESRRNLAIYTAVLTIWCWNW